ncbi:GNAT family N-acetyltransferase [Melghirimyces algeriensis]|uniref:Protein N-acetyltransferase, RimJ/RimL family n=1 Tax=Melghirimyces algeriensis TaxID=910412 RepID=A0A521FA63_9BACL|nr:GNAT family N-acetyltransferase [Melghirimyces algeriensis]SMO93063.1 Protein N-acetyltransferase, RimJ/RimL family [Melghirimyces algeriensis]
MIESNRLLFRPYTLDDLDFYASLWGNPEVVRYIGKGKTKTIEESRRSMENRLLPGYRDGLGLFAMVLKANNQLIGHAGLIEQKVDGQQEIEIGYWLLPDYWGKGLAKEAAITFKDYGLFELKYHKLISLINPNHPASIFVAKKAGLAYEKTVSLPEGDTLVYSISRNLRE